MIEVRWHGRGGQGAFTAARLLGAAASLYQGQQAMAFPSFGPERRGAPVLAFTKIDSQVISDRTAIQNCDYIIILDETLFKENYLKDLKPGGLLLINSGKSEFYTQYHNVIPVDAGKVAHEIIKRPITNTGMLGALAGLSEHIISLSALEKAAEGFFRASVLEKNLQIMERTFALAKEVNHEKALSARL